MENRWKIMDFHDFPMVLGKSGCRSRPPPQDVCRPKARRLPAEGQVKVRGPESPRWTVCTFSFFYLEVIADYDIIMFISVHYALSPAENKYSDIATRPGGELAVARARLHFRACRVDVVAGNFDDRGSLSGLRNRDLKTHHGRAGPPSP